VFKEDGLKRPGWGYPAGRMLAVFFCSVAPHGNVHNPGIVSWRHIKNKAAGDLPSSTL